MQTIPSHSPPLSFSLSLRLFLQGSFVKQSVGVLCVQVSVATVAPLFSPPPLSKMRRIVDGQKYRKSKAKKKMPFKDRNNRWGRNWEKVGGRRDRMWNNGKEKQFFFLYFHSISTQPREGKRITKKIGTFLWFKTLSPIEKSEEKEEKTGRNSVNN